MSEKFSTKKVFIGTSVSLVVSIFMYLFDKSYNGIISIFDSEETIISYQDSVKSVFLKEFQSSAKYQEMNKNGGIKIDSIIVIPKHINPADRVIVLYATNIDEAGALHMGTGNIEIFDFVKGTLQSVFKDQYYGISEYLMALVAENGYSYLLTQIGYSGGSSGDGQFKINIYDVSMPLIGPKKLKQLEYGYGEVFTKDSLPVVIYNENGFHKIVRIKDSIILESFELISSSQDLPNNTALLRIESNLNERNKFADEIKATLITEEGVFNTIIYYLPYFYYGDTSNIKYVNLYPGTKLLIDFRRRSKWSTDCSVRSWDLNDKYFMNAFPYISSDTSSNCNLTISSDFIIPIKFHAY